jgi:predicted nucleic acid-binding protein
MPSVYIETTIPSYYFETRRTHEAITWRAATRRWWEQARSAYELVTSGFVIDELSASPEHKSGPGLSLLSKVRVLPEHPRLAQVVEHYTRHRLMPADAVGDAAHLAMCALHKIDYLLTWNCRHLANANKVEHLRVINTRLKLHIPVLTTPLGLFSEEVRE